MIVRKTLSFSPVYQKALSHGIKKTTYSHCLYSKKLIFKVVTTTLMAYDTFPTTAINKWHAEFLGYSLSTLGPNPSSLITRFI